MVSQPPFITASFVLPDDAVRAIGALQDHGIPASRISVAAPHTDPANTDGGDEATVTLDAAPAHTPPSLVDKDGFMQVQTDEPSTPTDMNAVSDARQGSSSSFANPDSPVAAEGERTLTFTTPADAAKGAVEGSAVGLGLGLLAGAIALTLPGVGLILAAGPLWIALAGAAGATAAGAVAGGVTGSLRDLGGVPATLADHHTDALTRGSVVVTVHLGDYESGEAVAALLTKYRGFAVTTHQPELPVA